ncbi:tripartite tricarboxylate transporter TctB family protein [Marinomonas sp. 15G1-11]|uniref:Tripartite tricarboxylate transporter TctB family protein n=1 Tax=Marinomonas phaeophyticola TaxID=3004091 RepID=A0ABT4JPX6_9GAMM|nr:tripartite tricarboxylate transporter TctB family protein [Marinomonas sp. 15G1-11]MCZ2720394.1 tripartite tricarboxylate transporter TctB family protein [Marinomonas sp. 15G1-11]
MKKGEAFLGIIFVSFSALFGALGYGLYQSGRSSVGASQWPIIVCTIIFFGSIVVIVNAFRVKESKSNLQLSHEEKRVFISIFLLIMYFISVVFIGFFVSSLAMLYTFIYYFGKFKWYVNFVFSLAITSITYFVFSYLLKVSFQFGVLF